MMVDHGKDTGDVGVDAMETAAAPSLARDVAGAAGEMSHVDEGARQTTRKDGDKGKTSEAVAVAEPGAKPPPRAASSKPLVAPKRGTIGAVGVALPKMGNVSRRKLDDYSALLQALQVPEEPVPAAVGGAGLRALPVGSGATAAEKAARRERLRVRREARGAGHGPRLNAEEGTAQSLPPAGNAGRGVPVKSWLVIAGAAALSLYKLRGLWLRESQKKKTKARKIKKGGSTAGPKQVKKGGENAKTQRESPPDLEWLSESETVPRRRKPKSKKQRRTAKPRPKSAADAGPAANVASSGEDAEAPPCDDTRSISLSSASSSVTDDDLTTVGVAAEDAVDKEEDGWQTAQRKKRTPPTAPKKEPTAPKKEPKTVGVPARDKARKDAAAETPSPTPAKEVAVNGRERPMGLRAQKSAAPVAALNEWPALDDARGRLPQGGEACTPPSSEAADAALARALQSEEDLLAPRGSEEGGWSEVPRRKDPKKRMVPAMPKEEQKTMDATEASSPPSDTEKRTLEAMPKENSKAIGATEATSVPSAAKNKTVELVPNDEPKTPVSAEATSQPSVAKERTVEAMPKNEPETAVATEATPPPSPAKKSTVEAMPKQEPKTAVATGATRPPSPAKKRTVEAMPKQEPKTAVATGATSQPTTAKAKSNKREALPKPQLQRTAAPVSALNERAAPYVPTLNNGSASLPQEVERASASPVTDDATGVRKAVVAKAPPSPLSVLAVPYVPNVSQAAGTAARVRTHERDAGLRADHTPRQGGRSKAPHRRKKKRAAGPEKNAVGLEGLPSELSWM